MGLFSFVVEMARIELASTTMRTRSDTTVSGLVVRPRIENRKNNRGLSCLSFGGSRHDYDLPKRAR